MSEKRKFRTILLENVSQGERNPPSPEETEILTKEVGGKPREYGDNKVMKTKEKECFL